MDVVNHATVLLAPPHTEIIQVRPFIKAYMLVAFPADKGTPIDFRSVPDGSHVPELTALVVIRQCLSLAFRKCPVAIARIFVIQPPEAVSRALVRDEVVKAPGRVRVAVHGNQ